MPRFTCFQNLIRALVFIAPLQVSGISPEAAQTVFTDLVNAIGDQKTRPGFSINSSSGEIAQYLPLSHQIIVSPRFLDFAEGYGERSSTVLALVLGHELAHYYENHNLRANYSFASQNIHSSEDGQQRQSLEAEADYFAIFFAYMAGYPTEGIDENFIRELYSAFKITNSAHYPSLETRVEIFRNARLEIGKLTEVFEAGNLLLVLGQNEAAAHCFEYVGIQFTCPAVWNNAGVAYFSAALEYLPDNSPVSSLLFPLEFEEEMLPAFPGERTRQRTLAPEEASVLRLQFLLKAKACFEKASMQASFGKSKIQHLACTFLLLANELTLPPADRKFHEFDFEQSLSKLSFLSDGDPAIAGNISVLNGIQAMMSGDQNTAKSRFLEAFEKHGSLLGKINLSSLSGEADPVPGEGKNDTFETLHGITLFLPDGRRPFLAMVSGAGSTTLSGWTYDLAIRQSSLPNGKAVWINFLQPELSRTTTLYVLQATEGYPELSAGGIKPGSTEKQVEDAYGLPKKIVQSRQQHFWAYPETGVIFCLSKGKVSGIFNFFSKEED